MRILYTPRAARDLDGIFAFVAGENPRAARQIVDRIEAFIDLLSEFPLMGQAVLGGRLRSCPISDLPYRVSYRLVGGTLQIVHIRHARRRPLRS